MLQISMSASDWQRNQWDGLARLCSYRESLSFFMVFSWQCKDSSLVDYSLTLCCLSSGIPHWSVSYTTVYESSTQLCYYLWEPIKIPVCGLTQGQRISFCCSPRLHNRVQRHVFQVNYALRPNHKMLCGGA